jgi:type IV pilus assembly protein PilQ
MKKFSLWALTISFCVMLVTGCATMNAGPGSSDPAEAAPAAAAAGASTASVGYVEKITFGKTMDKEKVIISTSKLTGYTASREAAKTLVITLDKMYVPDDLKKKISQSDLKAVEGVYATQEKTGDRPVTTVKIVLKEAIPHLVREQGNELIIDVDTVYMPQSFTMTKEVDRIRATQPEATKKEIKAEKKEGKIYTGQKITADFQDANIRSVFRLIAEVSGLNIVAGEDVKGLITMQLKEVPWDQALETILDVQALGTKSQGNVIVVMPVEKIKKAEEQRLKEDVSRGKLKQISIEAQIIEANDTFLRQIGVQWGGGLLTNANGVTLGALGGSAGYATQTVGSTTTGATTALQSFPNGVGFGNSNLAVNFPFTFANSPLLGVLVGGSNFVLSAQINALESSSEGKIISSPKVTTLDNVKATIKQGEEIPYVTQSTSGGVITQTVQFKEAVLKLDVKPTITPEGKISMEIKATNDRADFTRSVQGNPPIIKNEVDSTVVVHNGDTIVIGGIYKSDDEKLTSGVPGLYKVPILGWLFKAENEQRARREILIFITPKIVPDGKDT